MLPTTQEYKISLMIGQDSFRTLEGVEVIPNPNYPDEPWYSTGGLAIVFKLKLKDKLYALKCFYTEANERQERLGLIAAYLKQNPSPYFVDFTYLENELWVETANDEGQGYPVVLMEWVEGKTLDNYLEQICTQNNTPALKNLNFQFCNLAWWLQQQPIAHGDIKHDNLIVTPDGKLKLIDYDGVFVPALHGRKANEMGSPCYQHPKRDAYFFDKNLDDFSLLVLQITLLALQHQPKLFTEHYNGDGIILKDTDYQNFAQSHKKTILWQLPEVKIPLLLSQLQGNLNNLGTIDLMPLLQDVAWINWLIDGQKDSKLEFERQRLKDFALNNKNWREYFINEVSEKYSLSEYLIEKYESRWNWNCLSVNKLLEWPLFIEEYEDNWNWSCLSDNELLPWSLIIEEYDEKWDWYRLSSNKSLPWCNQLIEKYQNKWNWKVLSYSSHLPWSTNLIEKYENKWEWERLGWNKSLPWSLELIEKYENKWGWDIGYGSISRNESLPWSLELVEKYENRWNWSELSCNTFSIWSLELIEKYKNKWNWQYIGWNESLPWSIELIEKYENQWDWNGLSRNESLPWSVELIEKYEDKWDWESLGWNESLPWSVELIEKYEKEWDWEDLSGNKSLPWSIELIEKYEDKWVWGDLSENKSLPWSIELIEKYEDKWDWEDYFDGGLNINESLPWSIELIEKYKGKWEWAYLTRNNGIYEKIFQPLLNDEFIDEIMAEI